jgi:N-terminal domain of oxidoreductase
LPSNFALGRRLNPLLTRVDCFASLAMTNNNNWRRQSMSQGKRVVLASRPVGEPKPTDFRIEEYAVPVPGAGEVLLRTVWLSLDPYMRGRMSDGPSYAQPGHQRRDGRRHGERGGGLQQSGLRQG